MPFSFETREYEALTREGAVFQALGAASMCWEHPGRAGVFNSTRAREIGEALLAFLAKEDKDGTG